MSKRKAVGNHSLISFSELDAETDTPVLLPLDNRRQQFKCSNPLDVVWTVELLPLISDLPSQEKGGRFKFSASRGTGCFVLTVCCTLLAKAQTTRKRVTSQYRATLVDQTTDNPTTSLRSHVTVSPEVYSSSWEQELTWRHSDLQLCKSSKAQRPRYKTQEPSSTEA